MALGNEVDEIRRRQGASWVAASNTHGRHFARSGIIAGHLLNTSNTLSEHSINLNLDATAVFVEEHQIAFYNTTKMCLHIETSKHGCTHTHIHRRCARVGL